MTTPVNREQERQAIINRYPLTYPLAAAIILILMGIAIGYALFGAEGVFAAADTGFWTNLYTEGISIAVTILVLNLIYERRANRERLQELITQMRSNDNGLALAAVEILRLKGWIEDGSLTGLNEDFTTANLMGADLTRANLERIQLNLVNLSGANLRFANLSYATLLDSRLNGANFEEANLEHAVLGAANFEGAKMVGVNLRKAFVIFANLNYANLQGAFLMHTFLQRSSLQNVNLSWSRLTNANLQGSLLQGADLEDANLAEAILDETTILPDGTNWTPDIDVTRFTDPNHPEFWRSDDPASPAYRHGLEL